MDPALMGATMVPEPGLTTAMGTVLAATCGPRASLQLLVITAPHAVGKIGLAAGASWMPRPAALADVLRACLQGDVLAPLGVVLSLSLS